MFIEKIILRKQYRWWTTIVQNAGITKLGVVQNIASHGDVSLADIPESNLKLKF